FACERAPTVPFAPLLTRAKPADAIRVAGPIAATSRLIRLSPAAPGPPALPRPTTSALTLPSLPDARSFASTTIERRYCCSAIGERLVIVPREQHRLQILHGAADPLAALPEFDELGATLPEVLRDLGLRGRLHLAEVGAGRLGEHGPAHRGRERRRGEVHLVDPEAAPRRQHGVIGQLRFRAVWVRDAIARREARD